MLKETLLVLKRLEHRKDKETVQLTIGNPEELRRPEQ